LFLGFHVANGATIACTDNHFHLIGNYAGKSRIGRLFAVVAEAVQFLVIGYEPSNLSYVNLSCRTGAFLVLFLGLAVDLSAQQSATGPAEFERIKAQAQKGDAQAQLALGSLYASGDGVAKDLGKAAKWHRKAAEQGLAPAQFELAKDYAGGLGVNADKAEAFKWFHHAADQDMPEAQFALGRCYAHGEGVSENEVEAVRWYQRAAGQNLPVAMEELGHCYLDGTGVATDLGEGVKWIRKAAESGYAPAQNRLGLCYLKGEGVKKDFVQAYKWFELGAAQGGELAPDIKVNLAKTQTHMTPEQIEEAQHAALEFKPRTSPDEISPPTKTNGEGSGSARDGGSVASDKGLGGLLSVDGQDITCEVYVDGSFVGNLPAKLHLPEGLHTVEVKKSGFKDYRKELKVSNGAELNLHVTLEKQ
jgi:TPR repeat protein